MGQFVPMEKYIFLEWNAIIVKGWSKNHKWNGKMIFFCLFFSVGFVCVSVCIFFFCFSDVYACAREKRKKSVSWYECYYYYYKFWYKYGPHVHWVLSCKKCSIFVMCSMRRKIYLFLCPTCLVSCQNFLFFFLFCFIVMGFLLKNYIYWEKL